MEENILATRNFFYPQKAAAENQQPCSAKQFEHAPGRLCVLALDTDKRGT